MKSSEAPAVLGYAHKSSISQLRVHPPWPPAPPRVGGSLWARIHSSTRPDGRQQMLEFFPLPHLRTGAGREESDANIREKKTVGEIRTELRTGVIIHKRQIYLSLNAEMAVVAEGGGGWGWGAAEKTAAETQPEVNMNMTCSRSTPVGVAEPTSVENQESKMMQRFYIYSYKNII